MSLPRTIDPAAFDDLHDDPPAWRPALEDIARQHGGGAVEQQLTGTALVAFAGADRVVKLYPPFLRDHFAFEQGMLGRLHGRLHVPTPRLLAAGEHEGWPYLVLSRLAGLPLTGAWPKLDEPDRLGLLVQLGELSAQVHALPVDGMSALVPAWPDFIARQRDRCRLRQQRTGLPAHLLAQVDAFVSGPLPEGPSVLLTGEYTPMNLLVDPSRPGRLAAMYDFGDGLVGPRAYDWLGPLAFLCAASAARCRAFLGGCGVELDDDLALALLRLLLLHRYSALPAQVACEGWQAEPDFAALARRIWPVGDGTEAATPRPVAT